MVHEIRTLGFPALLSFHTVARLGGISAAAQRLGLAKSGVSRHVAQLEAHFGVRLLERGARSVRLTPIGQKLDHRIQSILAEVDLLSDIAKEEASGISGQVSVAATPEFGAQIATHLFPAVRRHHPGLTLALRPAYEFEDMGDPGTDIAIRVGTFKDDRLVARKMGGFRCWIVAAPELAEAHPVKVPSDLEAAPCLTFRGDRTTARWTLFSGETEEAVDVAGPFGVRSFSTLCELAKAGEGFAFLPDFVAADAVERGALIRVLPDCISRPFPVFLSFRPGARRVARVDAVLSIAERVVPGLLSE